MGKLFLCKTNSERFNIKAIFSILIFTLAILLVAPIHSYASYYEVRTSQNGEVVKKDNGFYYMKDWLHATENTTNLYTEYITLHYGSGDTSESVDSYIPGKRAFYPAWQVRNGNYYYCTSITDVLKDTTTPDGYKVDSKGRWIDDSGNLMTDGYGNNVLNTVEKYAGKTDEEIWAMQRQQFIDLCKDKTLLFNSDQSLETPAYVYHESNGRISGELSLFIQGHQSKNYKTNGTNHCVIYIGTYFDASKPNEIMLRSLLGDALGIEMFTYLRSLQVNEFNSGYYEAKDYNEQFDFSKFNGRKTDYGKTIYVDTEGTGKLEITISNQ